MKVRRRSWPSPALLIGVVALLAAIYPAIAIGSSSHATRGAAASVAPASGTMTADTASTMTPASAPNLPAVKAPAGAVTDRPTMDPAAYAAAKAAADASVKSRSSGGGTSPQLATKLASTNTQLGNFNATGECGATVNDGCWVPPDVNGAVGASQLFEIVNNHVVVYTKSTSPSVLMEKTTNTFFAFGGPLTDPRVEYDNLWGRWVVSEQTFTNHLCLAISVNSDATGAWINYSCNITTPTVSLDYPQIGLQQDAVVWTYSDFAGPEHADTAAVAKWILYNGFGFSVPVFNLGSGTATPSNVIDQNPVEHELLYKPTVGVNNVSFTNPGNGGYGAITGNVAIPGVAANVPPSAIQFTPSGCPAPSCNLDTLDGRFQNDQTQYGNHLWAVHTQGPGLPTPVWYDIDPVANTVTQFGAVFLFGPSSQDFNPSIVANTAGTVNINWTTINNPLLCPPTNPLCGSNNFPGVVFTGRTSADGAGLTNPPSKIFSSLAPLTGSYDPGHGLQRWGDTSSIRMDPNGNGTAWLFNETVQPGGTFTLWGTRGAQVKTS